MNVNKLDNQDLRYERKFHSGTVSPAQVENFLKSNPLSFHKEFPDRIEVPKDVSEGFQNKIFLNLIEFLSKKAKRQLIKD